MDTRRFHGAHVRKRLARVALDAALLVALLLPWAPILAWLFWKSTLK